MGNGKSVRVGVGVIVRNNSKILLLRRKNVHGSGTWSTPGGHLDFSESPEDCAIREVHEETGLVVEDPKFYAITNDYFKEADKHYITVWMEALYLGGELRVAAEYESDRVEWTDLSDLPKNLFEPFKKLFSGETIPPKKLI